MRLSVILRRARRLGIDGILSSIQHQFQGSNKLKKHIKIDDEESLLDDDQSYRNHKIRPSPFFHAMKIFFLSLLILLLLSALIAYTIYKPPRWVINHLQRTYPDVLFRVDLPSSQRVVALSLDDAPSSETAKILDLLKEYGAKATFFVIGGQISDYPAFVKRMHAEGHEIGNHAWADEPSVKLPLSELERQIKEIEGMIPANANGAKYFRPGSGFFNPKMVNRVTSMGYQVTLGSIYPHDPQIPRPKMNARHVLSMVKPGGIIIMHDRRSYSAEQLELVLKGLTAKGWKIESVGGLLGLAEEAKRKKNTM